MTSLGIDAGASSSRWLLVDGDREVARGTARPITGHVFADADRARTLEHVAELSADVRRHGAPDAVVAGITGLAVGGEPARILAAALASGLGVDRARVRVTHDIGVAFRSAFRPGRGVLVYAGTGSIAYHESSDPDSPAVRIGGHGYLIDDAGGGFWIGRQALRSVLRASDRLGRRPPGALADEVFGRIGSDRWDDVRAFAYGGGRSAVASLTPAVGSAATRGDEDAVEILRVAGAELGRLASAMFERLDEVVPVALAGGVIRLGEPLLAAFGASIPASTDWRAHDFEPVEAAARWAAAEEVTPWRS